MTAEAFSGTLQSQDEERLLQLELQLARKTNIYFIIDLQENRVYVKARGIVLRDLEIKGKRFWGQADTVKLYVMNGKAAYAEPQREEVIPENMKKDEDPPAPAPAGTTAAVDIKALEIDDMPTSFILKLDDNFNVYVRPDNKGMLLGFYSIVNSINWYISQPMLTVWYSIKKSPHVALNLFLEEQDARALYWTIHEGSEVLIYNPQKH